MQHTNPPRGPLKRIEQNQSRYQECVKSSFQSSKRSFWISPCVDSLAISLNLSVSLHSETASRSAPVFLLLISPMCTSDGRLTHCPMSMASPIFKEAS